MSPLTNLKFTLDAISNPATIQDHLGFYIHCNQAYLTLIGKCANQIIGRSPSDILPPEEAKTHDQANKQLQASQSQLVLYDLVCLNPSSGVVSIAKISKSALTQENGKIAGFIAIYNVLHATSITSTKPLFGLTNKEVAILAALASGLSIKSIAKALGISTHTVSGHLKAIYLKMNVRSRAEAQYKASYLENITRFGLAQSKPLDKSPNINSANPGLIKN